MSTPPLTKGACAALKDHCNYRICVEPLILRIESVASEPSLGRINLREYLFHSSEGPASIAATLADDTDDTTSVILPVNYTVHDNRPAAESDADVEGGTWTTRPSPRLRAGDVIRILQMVRIPLFKPRINE